MLAPQRLQPQQQSGVFGPVGACPAIPGTTFGTIYTVDGRPYDVDARARGSAEARLLPSEQFAELGRLAPDLALTLQRRLLIEALEQLEWAASALMASR